MMKNTHAVFRGCIKAFFCINVVLLCTCVTNKDGIRYAYAKGNLRPAVRKSAEYPDTFFAVISDPHISDSSLGTPVPELAEDPASGTKLLLDGVELLDYAIQSISASGVRFVLISGDLTKEGELVSHRLMAEKLKAFTDRGIAVYVIPGNHDINNPNAVSLADGIAESVPSINAETFSNIYRDFGFGAALMKDAHSLSYVAEPVEGLWLLAIDSIRYREYTPENKGLSSGKISQKTADWIASVLRAAAAENKAVMVMMHHGVVEHWKGQSKFHANYLIEDFKKFGKFLASYNVQCVFTGHYHSQDIARVQFGGNSLYDIETGSLLIPSGPFRFVEIKNNTVHIRSETSADKIHSGTDFYNNAQVLVKDTIAQVAKRVLLRYKITGKDAGYIAAAAADAFFAHFEGDENPSFRVPFNTSQLGVKSRFAFGLLGHHLDNLWKDIPPADNHVSFTLR